ncbi:hypothetical protein SAFG77S_01449 [Streptomyces afghaniensis]
MPDVERVGDQRGREGAVVAGAHQVAVRPVGHQAADLAEVTAGGVPPGDDDLDVPGELLDLFEDVGREQHRAALIAHAPQQVHELHALAGVHAVEGLVQQEQRRVVDQGGGHLHALAHALGVRLDLAVLRVLHLDRGERPLGRLGAQAVQLGVGEDELLPGEEVVHRLPLGDDADVLVDLLVAPHRLAVEGDRAGGGGQEAAHHVDEGGLAGAVGAEQAGDAGTDGHGDVVDGDHVAEPAGDVVDGERGHSPTFL